MATLEDLFNDPHQFLDEWIPERFSLDLSDDGVADIELRTIGNSLIPNQVLVNYDGDKSADFVFEIQPSEAGPPRVEVKVDLDGNEGFDVALADLNGDWWPDQLAIDSNADGAFSRPLPTSLNGIGIEILGVESGLESWAAIDHEMAAVGAPHTVPEQVAPLTSPLEIASADASQWTDDWTEHWHQQQGDNTCGVCCQEFILETALDRDFTEAELAAVAAQLEAFSPMGTHPADLGALLEHFGIETELKFHAGFEDLAQAVRSGQGVIAGVDANELWDTRELSDVRGIPMAGANHAVQVVGIESEGDQQFVVLNDPGHHEGCGMRVPLARFMDAWHDSECALCVTRQGVLA